MPLLSASCETFGPETLACSRFKWIPGRLAPEIALGIAHGLSFFIAASGWLERGEKPAALAAAALPGRNTAGRRCQI
jgi:hypothetical protein